jgi:hypothetical protein
VALWAAEIIIFLMVTTASRIFFSSPLFRIPGSADAVVYPLRSFAWRPQSMEEFTS